MVVNQPSLAQSENDASEYLVREPSVKLRQIGRLWLGQAWKTQALGDLVSASHEANIAFLNHVASVHDVDKLDLFPQLSDGAYAA
jgi:hypothetical protein